MLQQFLRVLGDHLFFEQGHAEPVISSLPFDDIAQFQPGQRLLEHKTGIHGDLEKGENGSGNVFYCRDHAKMVDGALTDVL